MLPLDPYRGNYVGTISPHQEKWYTFSEGENPGSIILVLMFEPNPNLDADTVKFFLYDEKLIPTWPPQEPDAVANIGSGSRSAADRDGDLGTGELLWRGGPLQRNTQYYLRMVNGSTSTLRYCLATQDVYDWSCR